MAEDLYGILGVAKGADSDEIKKAYRKLAKTLHPDKNPGNKQAESRFKSVNHAFDVLGNPKKRKLYDEFGEEGLREGFDPDKVRQYKQWSSRQGGGRGGYGGGVSIEDLFGGQVGGASTPQEAGFGDMFGNLFGRARRGRAGPMKGQDLESEVTIDFASAVQGATLELRPQGAGSAPVTVRIPPGAADGSRVRLGGQGAPSMNGGPPGDLILQFKVTPHPVFRREGDDLHIDLPITVAEAYRGAKVKVPTIDGSVNLKVPERSQSGGVVRLRGKGVAKKGKDAGDLYVHFLIHIPTAASPELDAAIDALAASQTEDIRAHVKL